MKKLSKSDILAANDITTEVVEVPEWGGSVTVAVMCGTTKDIFEDLVYSKKNEFKKDSGNFRARLAAATIVDENGVQMFTMEEAEALGKKSAPALDRVFKVSARLNGLMPDSVEKAAKNSEPVPSDVSTTV